LAVTTVIGGNGYRWRGRSIRSIQKDNVTCVTMPRPESMIMVPCTVIDSIQYRVTITASKTSGNGSLLVNFFGGKHYDGTPIAINITSVAMRDYTIAVPVPKFPRSLPMYLRVWKSDKSTGNTYVKGIRFEVIGGRPKIPRDSRPPVIMGKKKISEMPPRPKRIKEKKRRPRPRPKVTKPEPAMPPKENKVMKFKPYNKGKATTTAAKVLIRNPEDVPMVSIITPTRDGIELLKKCYAAINDNTSYPNWEWIIGDSDSKDGTAECVKSWNNPRVKLVERGTTEGSFSSINNELVGFSSGEYLMFLNDDTRPQPFWLYEMMSKIIRHPKIGIVGAKLMYGENKIQHAGIAFVPQGPANLGKSVLGSFPSEFASHDRFYQAVTGACFLMRTSDFHSVNSNILFLL